jgi:hypothetical protein
MDWSFRVDGLAKEAFGARCFRAYLTIEKFKICRPFKNGEMQGSVKIQGAQCIAHT